MMRERHAAVLIDEFQDTDPVQWDIVRRAFGDDGTPLVLIGDPKQAIYAFRGADVHTYLDAAALAPARATLSVNWRSDQALLDALAAVFGDAALGDEAIRVRPVRAADPMAARGLAGGPDDSPLRVRMARCDAGHFAPTGKGFAPVGSVRAHIAADVATEAVRLLSGDATVREGDAMVPLRPDHLAVLVRTNDQGESVRDALAAAGVPAVIHGAGSVFATPAAADWLALLRALERPTARAVRTPPPSPRCWAGRPSGSPAPAMTTSRRCTPTCTTWATPCIGTEWRRSPSGW